MTHSSASRILNISAFLKIIFAQMTDSLREIKRTAPAGGRKIQKYKYNYRNTNRIAEIQEL